MSKLMSGRTAGTQSHLSLCSCQHLVPSSPLRCVSVAPRVLCSHPDNFQHKVSYPKADLLELQAKETTRGRLFSQPKASNRFPRGKGEPDRFSKCIEQKFCETERVLRSQGSDFSASKIPKCMEGV